MTAAGQSGPPGRRAGDRPFRPELWEAAGISVHEGQRWFEQRIEPALALRWRRAGVTDALEAVRWQIGGVDPRTVREWRYAQIDAGEAVVWSELGFNAARARRHKRAGRTPAQAHAEDHRPPPIVMPSTPAAPAGPGAPGTPGATVARQVAFASRSTPRGPMPGPGRHASHHPAHRFMQAVHHSNAQVAHQVLGGYMQRQWFDDDALAWAIRGIDAAEALAWKELGVTAEEAACQQEAGITAMQTAKAWWEAGIPAGEFAEWFGAGLQAQEAARQRAAGVAAEQAAILRSLRRGTGPPAA